MITGSAEVLRIQRHSSRPSVPGSIRSRTTRLGWPCSTHRAGAVAVTGLEHAVALALEIRADDLADDLLVVDDEDGRHGRIQPGECYGRLKSGGSVGSPPPPVSREPGRHGVGHGVAARSPSSGTTRARERRTEGRHTAAPPPSKPRVGRYETRSIVILTTLPSQSYMPASMPPGTPRMPACGPIRPPSDHARTDSRPRGRGCGLRARCSSRCPRRTPS